MRMAAARWRLKSMWYLLELPLDAKAGADYLFESSLLSLGKLLKSPVNRLDASGAQN
ncbi:hypothetical protein S1OALGB6SA_1516 [Olavius algarvensis spirochete endosymbiont]|uniref:hypothetical protein n=1 Tax=Olavius algarvensis spirochete endosymbiont TaxID=260710 RepID=UPI000F1AF053|nr:hypothetical protein [Olavius algarvensis spirochete endosymbiont]VDB00434.1 hypothetical protein S1OALGB6SA_1516 [Olavius algarvensis spirochete endosymbiont]